MPDFQKIGNKNEIENGAMKSFTVAGKQIAVANIEGQYFAIDEICSHAHCSLADGFVDGQTVICPCHGSTFDLTNGRVMSLPAIVDVASYQVKVEGDDILVQV